MLRDCSRCIVQTSRSKYGKYIRNSSSDGLDLKDFFFSLGSVSVFFLLNMYSSISRRLKRAISSACMVKV